MMSRATAGTAGRKAMSCPAPNAVKLAMTKLIIPELGHVAQQLNR